MANLIARCEQDSMFVDYEKFYKYLKDKHYAEKIYIFSGYFAKRESEYAQNASYGYTYIFKEAVFNKDESKIKANCDVDITIKCIHDSFEEERGFTRILISSDGDFANMLKYLIQKNINTKIISPAPPERCSYLLKKLNVQTIYLKQIIHHFRNEKALNGDDTP